jgi:hypothetical protein
MLGSATLEVEVTTISRHGLWILLLDRKLFPRFEEFPWFRGAPVAAILHLECPAENHLYWPDLDVDLTVHSIEHPDQVPLIAKAGAVPDA